MPLKKHQSISPKELMDSVDSGRVAHVMGCKLAADVEQYLQMKPADETNLKLGYHDVALRMAVILAIRRGLLGVKGLKEDSVAYQEEATALGTQLLETIYEAVGVEYVHDCEG